MVKEEFILSERKLGGTWSIWEHLHRLSLSGCATVWADLAHSQWAAATGGL